MIYFDLGKSGWNIGVGQVRPPAKLPILREITYPTGENIQLRYLTLTSLPPFTSNSVKNTYRTSF